MWGEALKAFKLKELVPTEDQEAQSLWQWACMKRYQDKHLSDFLIMIPNGAYLGKDAQQRAISMARMKRTGFKAGVFDYLLAIPRPHSAGLWLELKRRQLSVVSLEQSRFQLAMIHIGYSAAICKGWEEAKQAIDEYLH